MRVAVDGMGGDNAPDGIVAGAVKAHRELGVRILLTGPRADLSKALDLADASPTGGIEVVEAPDVIGMDEADPALAVRRRRESSVSVAARLVSDGRADAFFSAGATGAAMGASVLEVGRIRGARPAIATVLPFPGAPTVLLDSGANVEVRPEHLASFAVLGSVFAEVALGLGEPRVGLLSIGEEPGKGNELAKAAFPLLEACGVRFVGNVEGRDIPSDAVDVVVTDGFTGNVVLKLLEGFATFLMGELLRIFGASEEHERAADVLLPELLELRGTLDPEGTGGAHLLGVRGVCIIGHGSSGADGVRAAIDVAARAVDGGLVDRMTEGLGQRSSREH